MLKPALPSLRDRADRQTLVYVLVLIPGLPLLQYAFPTLIGWVVPLQLYLAFITGAIAHNHNHCPTLRQRGWNSAFSAWLSVLYGAPIFGWIPTHNQNHHRFTNGPGDDTITWRYWRENSLRSVLAYFFIWYRFQAPVIREYLDKVQANNARAYRETVIQRVAVLSSHVVMVALAIGLHGVARGLPIYLVAFVAQIAFALWSMFYINFVQHVDCDPRSAHDHSRNFVGKAANWLMFNSGYHTAHTERPGLHWTKLPALHAELAPHIDPLLNVQSLLGFTFRTYALGPFLPRYRTRQVGRPAWEAQGLDPASLQLPVLAVDAGVNAERLG